VIKTSVQQPGFVSGHRGAQVIGSTAQQQQQTQQRVIEERKTVTEQLIPQTATEQKVIHQVVNAPEVCQVVPPQDVVMKTKKLSLEDQGLQRKIVESAAGLNEYMNCLQQEANLLAKEKAEKQVLENVHESIVDTHEARARLDQQASLMEGETLHKLKEAEKSAQQMMADAKLQVKTAEANKSGQVSERIHEVRTSNKKIIR